MINAASELMRPVEHFLTHGISSSVFGNVFFSTKWSQFAVTTSTCVTEMKKTNLAKATKTVLPIGSVKFNPYKNTATCYREASSWHISPPNRNEKPQEVKMDFLSQAKRQNTRRRKKTATEFYFFRHLIMYKKKIRVEREIRKSFSLAID